jgi:hypothetical protein
LLRELSLVDITSEKRGGQNREGVGRDAILNELEGVHGINENVIKTQLATLKATGAYDRIVREVTALVEAEHKAELEALAEAERVRKKAEQLEAEAQARREQAEADKRNAKEERDRREAEAKAARDLENRRRAMLASVRAKQYAEKAEERRKQAAAEVETAKAARINAQQREKKYAPVAAARNSIAKMREQPKHEITLDEHVAKHFKNPHHVETFRRLATEQGKKYLPVERQEQLAKALVLKAHAEGKELTSSFIETKFNEALIEPRFIQNIINAKERAEAKAALLREGWERQMAMNMSNFSRHARGALSDAQKLANLNGERPTGATLLATNEFRTAVDSLKAALRIIEGKLI